MIHPIARGIEGKIVDYVVQTQRELRDSRTLRESVWMQCLEAYLSTFNNVWRDRARQDKRSARYVALTFDAVENLTTQIVNMIMPSSDWFHVEPGRRGGFDDIDDQCAGRVKSFLEYQHEQMKLKIELRTMVKWLVLCGNSVFSMDLHREFAVDYPSFAQAKQEWAYKQQMLWGEYEQSRAAWAMQDRLARMQGLPSQPEPIKPFEPEPEAPAELVYEGPRLVVSDPFNFVIDDRANDPLTAFRAITRFRTKAYLEHKAQVDPTGYAAYENLDQVTDASQHGADEQAKNVAIAAAFGMTHQSRNAVKLVEAVGDFEIPTPNDDGSRKLLRTWVAVVANDRTLLRFEPCHLWSREPHIRLATLIPCPGQTYGIGLIENVLGLQDSVNVRHNQVIDAIAVGINPEKLVKDDGVIDVDSMESGAGAVILVGDLDNVRPVVHNLQNLPLAFQELANYQALFEQISRSMNPSRPQGSNESATKIARDTSISGGSIQEIARFVEESAVVQILRMQLQYNQQYMNRAIAIRVTQDNDSRWLDVTPSDIRLGWSFRIFGSASRMERDKRIQDNLMFFQLVTGNPSTLPYANLGYWIKRQYEELGNSDFEQAFKTDEQVQAEMMAQMQQQAAMAAAQQGDGSAADQEAGGGGPGPGMPPADMAGDAGIPTAAAAVAPYAESAEAGRRNVGV